MIDPQVSARVTTAMSMIQTAVRMHGQQSDRDDGTPPRPGRSVGDPTPLLATVASVAATLLIELERELVPQRNGNPRAIDGHRLEQWLDGKVAELDPGRLH